MMDVAPSRRLAFACFAVLTMAKAAIGAESTKTALLMRCYAHLTQMRLSRSSQLVAEVENGRQSVADACVSLLDRAKLQSSGGGEGFLETDNAESRAVLRTLNDLHRSWFPSDDMMLTAPHCIDWCRNAGQVYDPGEAALLFTRVALTDGARLSEVVTAPNGMEALRSGGTVANTFFQQAVSPSVPVRDPVTKLISADQRVVIGNLDLAQAGELIGARRMDRNPRRQDVLVQLGNTLGNDRPLRTFPDPVPLLRSHGGGVLGMATYLLLNLGRPDYKPADGGLKLPRRWAKAVYSDLLCRDLPVIRLGDAKLHVQPAAPNRPPYRPNQTCMRCHSSMDNFAGVARAFVYAFTPWGENITSGTGVVIPALFKVATKRPRETGYVDVDPDFAMRPPWGRLFYRSYDGELVDREVLDLAGLGAALATSNDLYACTARRYYEFFTGITVPLTDLGDPDAEPLSASESANRELIIRLGQELKQHQSVRRLIHSILESPGFAAGATDDDG